MFYILMFGVVIGGYLLSLCRYSKLHIVAFKIVMFVLWAVLAFRYGQGSDYFSYKSIYEYCSTWENAFYNPGNVHGEIGYRILCFVLRGGGYEIFVALLSTFEMWMLYRGITRFSSNRWMSLCIFFPTGYMSCYFSSYRQGIVVAVFIGYLLGCMEERKLVRYYITVLLLAAIHSSALVLMLPPVILKFSVRGSLAVMSLMGLLGTMLWLPFVRTLIMSIPYIGAMAGYYMNSSGVSVLALLERVCYLIFVLLLLLPQRRPGKETRDLAKLYFFGVGIYFLLVSQVLLASRMMLYFKILEIFIIPNLCGFRSRWGQIVSSACIVLVVVMLVKNIGSYLDQGRYYEDVSILEYPYVSIYNKEKLFEYRRVPYWMDIRKELHD